MIRSAAPTAILCSLGFLSGQEDQSDPLRTGAPPALQWKGKVLLEVGETYGPKDAGPRIFRKDPGLAARVNTMWMAGAAKSAIDLAEDLIAADPEDPRGHALKYLARRELEQNRAAAKADAVRALKSLRGDPKATAEFVLEALLWQPTLDDYQVALMAIVPAATQARDEPAVRIAHVRALLGCGKAKEVLAIHGKIVEELAGNLDDLVRLVHAICDTKGGPLLHGIARRAVDIVAAKRGDSQEVRMLRYRVLHGLERDTAAARKLGERIVRDPSFISVNVWIWELLLLRGTRHRYTTLAGIAARRLLGQSPAPFDKDTAALGLFVNGLHDEALQLQEQSVEGAGATSTLGMRRRLRIYREVVASKARRSKRVKK